MSQAGGTSSDPQQRRTQILLQGHYPQLWPLFPPQININQKKKKRAKKKSLNLQGDKSPRMKFNR